MRCDLYEKVDKQKLDIFVCKLNSLSREKSHSSSNEFSDDSSKLWECFISQVCVRGGTKRWDSLEKEKRKEFLDKLSLNEMPLSYKEVIKIFEEFKPTRFWKEGAKTVIENYSRCFSGGEFKFISLLTENIPEKKLSEERIKAERRIRKELKKHYVWAIVRKGKWQLSHWKNKPVSDWLKDIGFAIALMPFDSRVKKILKKLEINLNEQNYEDVEDFFIKYICPEVNLLPVEVDWILFNKHKEVLKELED